MADQDEEDIFDQPSCFRNFCRHECDVVANDGDLTAFYEAPDLKK